MIRIKFFELEDGKKPFKEWFLSLDLLNRTRVSSRLDRVKGGNFGDYKKIGPDLYELRFFFGKGYRVYFTMDDGVMVILLCGGDKSTQQRDIRTAQKYLRIYQEKGLGDEI